MAAVTAHNRTELLREHQASSQATALRPILTSINGNVAWLVSLPRPSPSPSANAYFHVVVDPWFGDLAVL
ncbi:hypothetical protein Micbo1qcDRAFT_166111, partial [Microdochium bolleyi]